LIPEFLRKILILKLDIVGVKAFSLLVLVNCKKAYLDSLNIK